MSEAPKLIPEGYTYINNITFVSRKTDDAITDLLAKLDKRDPDLYAMYIYNDFFNYAQLDMVDKQLSSIHSKIVKKEWNEAYQLLETLSVWMEMANLSWPMVDDGERVKYTDKVYGAALITVIRALKAENRLDVEHFPTLKTFLRYASSWGMAMHGSGMGKYTKVLNAIGRRVFNVKDQTPESQALEKARVEEWITTLPAEEQEEIRKIRAERPEEEEEEEDEDDRESKYWYDEDGADEDYDHRSFVLSRVWKEYKGYLKDCPNKPRRGPPEWDLSKWSDAQKAPFLFDNMDDNY
ncbi:hypothetical protein EUX98_g3495 [Antrodiella citrinella]|uniref:Uncharacterized protein n=1 Tax=Antrodiella citrinella TaxID=2447956 RepID=A0A4S4MWF5_9APHY|nr:hypothetical protein EUX98_g3495 [Antrodiella citrinella]